MQATSTELYDIIANNETWWKIHFAKEFPRSVTSRPTEQSSFVFTNWRDKFPFKCLCELDPNTWKTNFLLMATSECM